MARFTRRLFPVSAILFASCLFAVAAPARAATAADVQAAIDKARAYLIAQQHEKGQWEPDDERVGKTHEWEKMQGDTYGGYTALATYALLSSGSTFNDPPIEKAVKFLRKTDIVGVYALGCRLQVYQLMYEQTKDEDYKRLAQRDADHLVLGLNTHGVNAGLWNYIGVGKSIDNSCSQFGILGLWAAAQTGADIPADDWGLIDLAWRHNQYDDGGWSYKSGPHAINVQDQEKPDMTAAGVSTLFITQQYTRSTTGVDCKPDKPNNNIANGLDWMTKHFDEANDLYTFYGVERIGVASGYKYFGTTDWFAKIADKLVKNQNADGSWSPGTTPTSIGSYPGESSLPDVSFGILFLARGGSPVMMNKLDYSITTGHKLHEANWNQRPRDIFNLSRWAGTQAEANLNWQVVNLDVSVDELHDAPILYIAGDQNLELSDDDVSKLRQFINEGGMILGNSDCDNSVFKMSFIGLGKKMFPNYQFRPLDASSQIFHEDFKKFRAPPDVSALSNGVREVMVLFPTGDPAHYWQTDSTVSKPDAFGVGFDVFQYAVDSQGMHKKGDTYIVHPDPAVQPTQSVRVARLMVGDNPDPEPGGWPRLAAILHNENKIDLQITPVKSGDSLGGYKIVHLTGTTKFTLSDDDRSNLLEFTQHGGMLIIDAAGGSSAFADAAQTELQTIYGTAAIKGLSKPLPPWHILYANPAAPIPAVSYRNFAKSKLDGDLKAPRIQAIDVHRKTICLFSREDLSAGLVGEQVDGILGYTPASAVNLMRNMILYTLDQKALRAMAATMPATLPATQSSTEPAINTGH
jgi:Domain of unknown function (DUF4159)